MGRFMYVHFGDDVPQSIEKEYNKLLRREQYMVERDAENGLIDADFDDVLAAAAADKKFSNSFSRLIIF